MVEKDVVFILGKPEDAGRDGDNLVFLDLEEPETGGLNFQDRNYSFPWVIWLKELISTSEASLFSSMIF